MRVFHHAAQRRHDPAQFLVQGRPRPCPEKPARIDALLAGVAALGLEAEAPADLGLQPLAAVHTSDYLLFLKTIHDRWRALEGAAEVVVPNVHPRDRRFGYPRSPVGQAGWHMADTACPISADTWDSVYWSAQSAVAAADAVAAGAAAAYALCRPPGHHPFADQAGGFCFVNNAALAAERLSRAGRRPAIVDVDLHHGNGTQGIFYERRDVLTVSVHADPADYYPFFWGHAQECGAGAGIGANLNLPLPLKTGDEGFAAALEVGIERVRAFAADTLVIALGLDAFAGDPFGGLTLTTPGFARIAGRLASLGLPTVIVQEGGYPCPELGDNLARFLGGFAEAHRP